MDSKETSQMLLQNVMEIKDTISTLNERSKNYYDLLSIQEKRIKINEEDNKENLHRIEKLEIALANLKIVEEHDKKIKDHDKDIQKIKDDIAILKRDRYWISVFSGFIGSIIVALIITGIQNFLTNWHV